MPPLYSSTNSKEQSNSWRTEGEKFPSMLSKPKDHCHVYRSIQIGNVLCQLNPVSILMPYFQDPVLKILSHVHQYLLSRDLFPYFFLTFVIPHVCAT
jgi:hypothetical protein